MTLTDAPTRPAPSRSDDERSVATAPLTVTFRPPVHPRAPRPATPPDPSRPGAIGAVTVSVRHAVSEPMAETVVDPRIAARRADVEDEADRIRLRPILAVLGVLVAAVVVLAVLWSPLFSVHRITVEGVTEAERGTVLAAANIQDGTPLVTVDVAAARARVAALPMIDGVRVARVWPRTVVITVATRTPLAAVHVPGSGSLAVVDAQGRVIAVSLSEDPSFDPVTVGLPVIESTRTRRLVPGTHLGGLDLGAVRAVAALDSDVRANVREVRREGRIVVLRMVANGRFADVRVVLGQPDDLQAKSLALRSVLSQGDREGKPISGIDVSVPDAPILTEKQ